MVVEEIFIPLAEASSLLGVSAQTVRRWSLKGSLRFQQHSPRKFRVLLSDVLRKRSELEPRS